MLLDLDWARRCWVGERGGIEWFGPLGLGGEDERSEVLPPIKNADTSIRRTSPEYVVSNVR